MTKRTKYLGRQTGMSSADHLSPQNPQTGDGRTRRTPHDQVKLDNPPKNADTGK